MTTEQASSPVLDCRRAVFKGAFPPSMLTSFLALLILSAPLAACDRSLPPTMQNVCLAEDAAGATRLLDGYPVGMLDKAYHGSTGKVSMDGGILRVLVKDRLTNKKMNFALEFSPGVVNERSDQCGPKSLIVRRISVDGQAASGLDMQDVA